MIESPGDAAEKFFAAKRKNKILSGNIGGII